MKSLFSLIIALAMLFIFAFLAMSSDESDIQMRFFWAFTITWVFTIYFIVSVKKYY